MRSAKDQRSRYDVSGSAVAHARVGRIREHVSTPRISGKDQHESCSRSTGKVTTSDAKHNNNQPFFSRIADIFVRSCIEVESRLRRF